MSNSICLAEGHIQSVCYFNPCATHFVNMAFGQKTFYFHLHPGALPQATMKEAFGQTPVVEQSAPSKSVSEEESVSNAASLTL